MNKKQHWYILIGIGFSIPMGIFFGSQPQGIWGWEIHPIYDLTGTFDFLGRLFLNALKMLIVPLIASAIITGIAHIGGEDDLGKLGIKTLLYYASTSFLAILVGLVAVNLMHPGSEAIKGVVGFSALDPSTAEKISSKDSGDIVGIFLRMVPSNIVAAAAEGKMLGLITFSLIFGYFLTKISPAPAQTLLNFWNGVYEVMMKLTHLVMLFAPVGVFGLIAKTISTTGFAAFKPLLSFFLTVLFSLSLHMFVVLPLLLIILGRINPRLHYTAMAPALLTAFSTSSSSATLPETMECVQKRAGVSKKVASFTLPLGATVNMDGTALYECVAALFIAQVYGLELTWTTQFTVVWVALLTSVGVAGIPAASLVAIALILSVIGLPLEGIGLILAVDRILDMCRTSVNVFSDSCAAVIIARTQRETPFAAGKET